MQNKAELRKQWTLEQDIQLFEAISVIGSSNWQQIAIEVKDRSGKQCRERWRNQLNPLLNHSSFTVAESWIIFIMRHYNCKSWTDIALQIPGRSDCHIKNFWKYSLQFKQRESSYLLDSYVEKCITTYQLNSTQSTRKNILNRLFELLVHTADRQYFDSLKPKLFQLRFSEEYQKNSVLVH